MDNETVKAALIHVATAARKVVARTMRTELLPLAVEIEAFVKTMPSASQSPAPSEEPAHRKAAEVGSERSCAERTPPTTPDSGTCPDALDVPRWILRGGFEPPSFARIWLSMSRDEQLRAVYAVGINEGYARAQGEYEEGSRRAVALALGLDPDKTP